MARKRRKSSRSRRSRKHRRNGKGTPAWFWPAFVVSGLVCVGLWKMANPTKSLNPTV